MRRFMQVLLTKPPAIGGGQEYMALSFFKN